jgi:TIR domain-containing protein
MDMTETKRPLKVFLCHAHGDKNAVRELYVRLTKDGVDAWLDKEKLLPGQDWELGIRKAMG